jgi:hypothetical protein
MTTPLQEAHQSMMRTLTPTNVDVARHLSDRYFSSILALGLSEADRNVWISYPDNIPPGKLARFRAVCELEEPGMTELAFDLGKVKAHLFTILEVVQTTLDPVTIDLILDFVSAPEGPRARFITAEDNVSADVFKRACLQIERTISLVEALDCVLKQATTFTADDFNTLAGNLVVMISRQLIDLELVTN